MLVFGDSWTYGSAASLPTLGYAYVLGERLGWETTVDGVRGSGYLKPGLTAARTASASPRSTRRWIRTS